MFAIKYGAKIDGWRYLDKVYLLVLLVFYIELDRFLEIYKLFPSVQYLNLILY